MVKDFPDPTKIAVPSLEGEEVVVGVHASGVELEEGLNTSNSRNYCSNCKRKIHCYVKIDKDTKEAKIHITCKSPDCECKCKTHFACKRCGYLHPYGQKCDRVEPERIPDTKNDEEFEKLMDEFRESQKTKSTPVKKKEN